MREPKSKTDARLDEALEETFPASDPVAITVETGARGGKPPASPAMAITDNQALRRFELRIDDETAFLVYERTPRELKLIHTEVPPALRGRGLGKTLVESALDTARAEALRPVTVCPFAKAYLEKRRMRP